MGRSVLVVRGESVTVEHVFVMCRRSCSEQYDTFYYVHTITHYTAIVCILIFINICGICRYMYMQCTYCTTYTCTHVTRVFYVWCVYYFREILLRPTLVSSVSVTI